MNKRLKLTSLIEEMDIQIDEYTTFLHKKTWELVFVSDEMLRVAEDDDIEMDKYREWQQEMLNHAIDIIENEDDYIEIPSKYDIHEYEIMERFSLGAQPSQVSDKLCHAIRGRSAFRRFNDLIIELQLENEWYDYIEKQLRELAIEWCNSHGIEYE